MPTERKLVVRDGDRRREVLLVGVVTVGRSPSCEISSADPRLSRAHAAFEVVGNDVIVRDLTSRNGTRVNGERITEHRLVAGDAVEIGPFTLQLAESAEASTVDDGLPSGPDLEATVRLPPRVMRSLRPDADPSGETPAPGPATPPPTPSPAAPGVERSEDADAPTRMIRRVPTAAPGRPPAPSGPPLPATESAPPRPAPRAAARTSPTLSEPAPRRAPAGELTFARVALMWVVPVALVSFLAGLVPDLLRPDDREPLLQAHYAALATSAAELVRVSREPALPLDGVTSALRRYTGVSSARILGTDGRVLAPMNEAGTSVTVPPLTGSTPSIVAGASGIVDLHVPASTADGRAVVVAITVDPSDIHPAPAASVIGTVLLLLCLGTAWLVARRLTGITDARLSRLGEEVELMTTGQVLVGRDPFDLRGGQRILDAATFALSPAGRRPGDGPRPARPADEPTSSDGLAFATIAADAGFRIVHADAGCESLLGLASGAAPGLHLVDALGDQAVADEVLRLVTLATPGQPAHGEAAPAGRDLRLGIAVTRSGGDPPLLIRFTRL